MKFTQGLLRAIETVCTIGYFMIVGSVVYFIIGAVARQVHHNMLDWTMCGTLLGLFHADACNYAPHLGFEGLDHFAHRVVTAPIPWFMMAVGLMLVGLSLPLIKLLSYTTHENVKD